ncbi:MAG: HYR domain-containing protein [Chitinophagaceae bacterium]|nr:MAG: HYR domain-containing protein [Chitinophagaceae bacterium]
MLPFAANAQGRYNCLIMRIIIAARGCAPVRKTLAFCFLTMSLQCLAQNPLDRVGLTAATPASPAYSLRKLSTTYMGYAIRVRRGADGAFQDVGFTAAGDLDTATLKTFIGSGDGFVLRWYDQSGSALDVYGARPATQPRIVNAGVVERLNGRPAIWFGGSRLGSDNRVVYTTAASMVGVAKGTATTPSSFVTKTGAAGPVNPGFPGPFDYSNTSGFFWTGDAATNTGSYIETSATTPRATVSSDVPAAVHSFVIPGSSGTFYCYINGVEAGSATVQAFSDGGNSLVIGDRNDLGGGSSFWTPEVVLFNKALSHAERTTLEAAQKAYYVSDEADLSALTISSAALSPVFSPGIIAYSAGYADSVTVTPTTSLAGATISVRSNGGAYSPVASATASPALPLNVGVNIVEVRVTSQSGVTKTYSIEISRLNSFDVLGLNASLGAVPALSLRRLGSAYAGKAVRVRRSSDNATLDIGFLASGDLDTAALKTFAGAGNAFITRWYDQSGNGVDMVQASNSSQPRIVNAGVIERINKRPAIWFGTANLATSKRLLYSTAASLVGVAKGANSTPSAFVTKTGTAAGANPGVPAPFDFTNTSGELKVGSAGAALANAINAATTMPVSTVSAANGTAVYSFVIPGAAGTYYNYLNGVQAGSQAVTAFEDGGNELMIGNNNDGNSAGNLWAGELVLFNSSLSNADRNVVEQAQKAYFLSDDASLSALAFSNGWLSQTFSPGTLSYTATLPYNATIIPTANSGAAQIELRVNGGPYSLVGTGMPSLPIPLNSGANTVEIRLTSQAGNQQTYTITVMRSSELDALGIPASVPALPAYSLRRLSAQYTGKAMLVRRSTDNALLDIGFTTAGDLDTISLKSFVGVASGFVARWYDQSGFGVDAAQPSNALQPRIVNAGVVDRMNGRPALLFATSNLFTDSLVLYPSAVSMLGVARGTSGTNGSLVTKTGMYSGVRLQFPSPFDYGNTAGAFLVGDAEAELLGETSMAGSSPISSVSSSVPASVYGFVIAGAGVPFYSYLNGTQVGSATSMSYRDGGAPLRIGNRNDGNGSGNFYAFELVLFNSALSTTIRNTAEEAQKSYYDIPCADVATTAQPSGTLACTGTATTFSVSATGSNVNYQWLRNGVPIGVTTAALSLNAITAGDAGDYTCVVSNGCRTEVSAAATLSIPGVNYTLPGPTVAGVRNVCTGQATTLSATGLPGATMDWYTQGSGGQVLLHGSVLATPALTADTTYYVAQTLCGVEGTRRAVTILVTAIPGQPAPSAVSALPASICRRDSSSLVATVDAAAGHKVHWYDAPTGGNLLAVKASGDSFRVSPAATATYYAQSKVAEESRTFVFTGAVQTFTVPAGVTSIRVDAYGAAGGGSGVLGSYGVFAGPGLGGRVQSTLAVMPGDVLFLYVGGKGYAPSMHSGAAPGPFNGGGGSSYTGSTGGGATDIRIGGQLLADRILVAGGGGGGYVGVNTRGGDGGGLQGQAGQFGSAGNGGIGGGGKQTEGGFRGNRFGVYFGGAGTFGIGGVAGEWGQFGGGGGGGWYGGGGSVYGGGGGGSSYTNPAYAQSVVHTQGVNSEEGRLVISFAPAPDCADTARVPVTVTVVELPVVSVPDDFLHCAGAPLTLNATGAASYLWQPTGSTGSSLTVAPTATTTYTVYGTNGTGCVDSARTTVRIEFAATDATICAGQTATLTASGADQYLWTPGGATTASVQVAPASTTVYTVQATNAQCTASKNVTVTVNPLPVVDAGSDQTITAGSTASLLASGADTYQWQPLQLSGATLIVRPTSTTSYSVTGMYSSTGCQNTDVVQVNVNALPSVTGTTALCSGGTTTLVASGTGPFQWYDAALGGNLVFTGASFTTPPINNDTAYWLSANGSARVKVGITTTSASLSATPSSICAGFSTQLGASPASPANVTWYASPTDNTPLQTTIAGAGAVFTPASTTTYYGAAATVERSRAFEYTGSVQTFTVPAGVTSIRIDAYGASGGGNGGISGIGSFSAPGLGGRVQGTMNVTPGDVLYLYIGGKGYEPSGSGASPGPFNGGGGSNYLGSTGGGATDIRLGGQALTDRILVAGGGGGSYIGTNTGGGNGGGLQGQDGQYGSAGSGGIGGGGTQTGGGFRGNRFGVYFGSGGSFGFGGAAGEWGRHGGGGGGGWLGGGGSVYGGGGGGSSYTSPAHILNVSHWQGYNEGNGQLVISYGAACIAPQRQPVEVTVTPAPAIGVVADKDTTCSMVQLTASGGISYVWNITPGFPASVKVAAGLHQIVATYNGPVIQLRRTSDNALQDFSLVNGELDLVAIASFTGEATARCTRLYDQSGNGNHFVQTNAARQPLFVASGINGRPVLRVSSSPATFMTNAVSVTPPYTAIYLARQNGPARGRMLSSVNTNWLLGWHNGNKSMAFFEGWVSPSGNIAADAQPYVYAATRMGSTSKVYENGALLYSSSSGSSGIDGLQMNGFQGQPIELSDADFADILLFGEALSARARGDAEQASARYYGIAASFSGSTISHIPSAPSATYTVIGTDANGCSAAASKRIVVDGKPPTVQCPGDQLLLLNASCQAALPDYRSLLTVSDNCTPASGLEITQAPAPGTLVTGIDTLEVVFTVRDSALLASTCSLLVRTRDTTAVRIQCPASRQVLQEIDSCGAHVTLAPITAANCRLAAVAQSGGIASGALFPVGANTVSFTATDADGATATCSYQVTVVPIAYSVRGADTVCAGGTALLSVDSVAAGTIVNWYTEAGGGSLIATGNPVSMPIGTFYARFAGPCGLVERAATNVSSGSVPLTFSGDTTLCPGTRGFLTATGYGVLEWTYLKLPVNVAQAQAQLAVGLRLLNSSYTGPLVRLRRSSDGAEQNFSASGDHLDTIAIRSWLGADAAYCVTLFDQSGQAHDITQATAAAQPQLILSSTTNNRPALRFNTAQYMQLGTEFTTPYTITSVARQTGGVRARVLSSVNNNWLLGWHGGREGQAFFNGWLRQSGPAAGSTLKVYTGSSTGALAKFYENGALLASGTGGLAAPSGLQLNGFAGNSERSDCEINEVIVFGSVLPDSALVQVERSALAYFRVSNRLPVYAPEVNAPQTFTAIASSTACGTTTSNTVTVRSAAAGDPASFGDGVWNVYAWGKGGASITAGAWSEYYSGYYTSSGLNFNTAARWTSTPSLASGYQGCAVATSDHSWSAKRKGFPCSRYMISIGSHDDAGQLWINGVKVWEHNACCDSHSDVWRGSLGPSDSVEFRVTQGVGGSEGAIMITDLSSFYTLNYPISAACRSNGDVAPTISQGGATFSASPSGLLIDPATGVIQPAASFAGTYTVSASWPLACGIPITSTASFTVLPTAGDPSVFGTDEWRVYVWNSGGSGFNPGAWSNGYAGYYTASGLDFNSTAQWASGTPPSDAAGYQGCAVAGTNHSWSAKREGFPCSYYRISVTGHDDAAQLWVNGTKVWEHVDCCDAHTDVWEGVLGTSDRVEFRVSQGVGGAMGSITFATGYGVRYSGGPYCTSASPATPGVTLSGGVFSASPAGLLVDSNTGAITPSGSLAGTYTVTYATMGGCGDTVRSTTPVVIIAPEGDPTVAGVNEWKVYVWGAGGNNDTIHSWNTQYAGMVSVSTENLYTDNAFPFYDNPSQVPGFAGCPVSGYNFSWSAKRSGFSCGRYRIRVPEMYGSGELWISGTRVAYLPEGSANDIRWEGYLTSGDVVEIRARGNADFGMAVRLNIQSVANDISFHYPANQYCGGALPETATMLPTITGSRGGIFSAAPAGLSIDSTTGMIAFGTSQTGDYTITYTFATPCGAILTNTTSMAYHQVVGDPSVFGQNRWNVYVWNGGGVIDSATWVSSYSGYYVDSNLNLYSTDRWNDGEPPSNASGYEGCKVGGSNNAWSAKRKGFPCGYYHLSIDSHDDEGQLWINGVKVWEHAGCCDSHPSAWEGLLGPADSVEFRVTQGVGGSNGRLSVTPGQPTLRYTNGTYCHSQGTIMPTINLVGGNYTATPAGLSLDTATGIVDALTSVAGTYTVSMSYASPCGDTLRTTGSITITAPSGDPSVAGNGSWNIYFWAAGNQEDSAHSWNTAYAGYMNLGGLNTNVSFLNGDLPSSYPAYQGCPIPDEKFSWIMKRTGFPCGRYNLTVIVNEGPAQVYINGVRILYIDENPWNNFSPQWQGFLTPTDIVEIRMRSVAGQGSRLRLSIASVASNVRFSYPAPRYCVAAGASDPLVPVLDGAGSGTFSATPAGLSINAATGVIDQLASAPGFYTVTFTGVSVCGVAARVSTTIEMHAIAGDPSVFGSNLWNVYAWNAGDLSGTPWVTNYAGFYTVNTLNLNTADQWSSGGNPSEAPGYTGCPVEGDSHSWSAKRKGFPCGRYQFNIPDHDDAVELWVDGVKVFSHEFCCDSHINAWTGNLGPTSEVEFRVREGVGGSGGSLNLVLVQAASTWTGAMDSNWNNAANWCGGMPDATTDVVIQQGTNQPVVLNGGTANVHDLIVQAGTSLSVLGTLNLFGNLSNNGGTLNMSSGRLDLEGTDRQAVPAFMVHTLNVNGGGGFTLSGSSTVSSALSFGASGGTVILGAFDLTVGSVAGGDAYAFVVTNGAGALICKALNGSQLMPVGVSSSSYTPLNITSSEGLDWSVRLQSSFAGYNAVNQGAALPRIWHITPSLTPTTVPVDLVFTYPDTLWTTPATVAVYRHHVASGGWGLANANATNLPATLNGNLRSVTLQGQQGFSPFAISGMGAALPVTLLHFTGREDGLHNLLQWQTASEQNNLGFFVERSADGRSFSDIGFVPSAANGGNSSIVRNYHLRDSTFTGLRHFYRLRQTDLDGQHRWSQTVSISRQTTVVRFVVYPNPAKDVVHVRFEVQEGGKYHWSLSAIDGRSVRSQQRNMQVGVHTETIKLQGLPAGIYQLRITDDAGAQVGVTQIVVE